MSRGGWGSTDGIPLMILEAIDWKGYVDTASEPYPMDLVPTEANAKAHREYAEKRAMYPASPQMPREAR